MPNTIGLGGIYSRIEDFNCEIAHQCNLAINEMSEVNSDSEIDMNVVETALRNIKCLSEDIRRLL